MYTTEVSRGGYATYFDGLLSADKKATEIYRLAKFVHKKVFALPDQIDIDNDAGAIA
jgi:hypothetical protein